MKRKKSRYQLISPSHKDKTAPAELDLLHTRALLCVRNFTHYKGGADATESMERLFRDYKKHPKEVKERLKQAFEYIRGKYKDLENLEVQIAEARKVINELAKKVFGANR